MPNAAGQTDPTVLEAARRGDQHAFRTLYLQHAGAVFRLVRSLGVPAGDVDDAVQEVFLTAFRKLDSFGGEERFFPWLCRIAVYVSKRQLSNAYWWNRLHDLFRQEPMAAAPPGPEADARRRERVARVEAVLGRIAEKKRTVLVLRDLMEFSEEETATIVGAPRGTVATRLHHARRDFERLAKKMRLSPGHEGED